MSMMFMIPITMMTEMKASNSPMNILILILLMVWFSSMMMMMMGSELWSLIYLIMLFNGGLMITYLFVISMIPKEKKPYLKTLPTQITMMFLIYSMSWNKMEKTFNEFLNLSLWMLTFMMIMISLISFFIFTMMMDPFKTMKSSF